VNPENYRIKDDVVVEVDIEEKRPDGTLVPFKADDIQLEFIRLDPFHRLYLKQEDDTATYKAQLVVPDTLGIYKLKISHHRYGYTFIEQETIVSCIQFRHDEYPRFLNIAFPYYTNVFLTMGAGFLFVVFFLYSDVDKGIISSKKLN
jgi:oligosaccharyltransferase complex subunit beta